MHIYLIIIISYLDGFFFVKTNIVEMTKIMDTLAYYTGELITAIEDFMVQAPGVCTIKTLQVCNIRIPQKANVCPI